MTSATRSISVASRPSPIIIIINMPPQPTGGFEWMQAPPGDALVCRALEPFAAHLFTTRQWPLGSTTASGDRAAWADVSRAIAIDEARLVRVHQVHGAAVVVRRRHPDSDAP